jgi:hypothetical protein
MAMKQLKNLMLGGVRVGSDVVTGRGSIGCGQAAPALSTTIPATTQPDNRPRQVCERPADRAGRSVVHGCATFRLRSARRAMSADLSRRSLRALPATGWYPAYRGSHAGLLPAMRRAWTCR